MLQLFNTEDGGKKSGNKVTGDSKQRTNDVTEPMTYR